MEITIRFNWRQILLTLGAVAVAAGLSVGYWYALDTALAGYRGVKEYQLEQNRERDARRREIAGVPAARDRILKREFGDLPETPEVRTDLQLLRIWQHLLVAMFAPFVLGTTLYLALSRRKSWLRRAAVSVAVILGLSQTLPMLLLPTEALKAFYRIGIFLALAAALYLGVEALRDAWARRRMARAN